MEDECHELDIKLATLQIMMSTSTVPILNSYKQYYSSIATLRELEANLSMKQQEMEMTQQAIQCIAITNPTHLKLKQYRELIPWQSKCISNLVNLQ